MKFISDIGHSIYDPKYYNELITKSFGSSVAYYFKLVLIASLILSAGLTFKLGSSFGQIIPKLVTGIKDNYPKELVLTLKGGEASSNVAEPYKIPMPTGMAPIGKAGETAQNLIVINTKDEASLDLYRQANTLFLIGKHDVISKDNNGKISVQSLAGAKDFTLTKSSFDYWVGVLAGFSKFLIPIMFVAALVASFVGISIINLVYSVFWALVVWLIAVFTEVKIGYGKAYQLTLHLLTIVLIIDLIKFLVPFNTFPFWSFLLIAAISALNFSGQKKLA